MGGYATCVLMYDSYANCLQTSSSRITIQKCNNNYSTKVRHLNLDFLIIFKFSFNLIVLGMQRQLYAVFMTMSYLFPKLKFSVHLCTSKPQRKNPKLVQIFLNLNPKLKVVRMGPQSHLKEKTTRSD